MKPYAGFTQGTVTSRNEWNESLFSLRVKVPKIQYVAGQFVKLALFDDEDQLIRRAYSIVNSPEDHAKTQEVEFLIVSAEFGQLSPRLHKLAKGDTVLVSTDAAGFMTQAEIPSTAQELWLLSTGTAIGPYLAMLEQDEFKQRFNKIVLVNAVRHQQDLTYSAQIQRLLQEYNGRLSYVPIISRESHSGTISGRVPALLADGSLEQAAKTKLDKAKSFVYICGNPQMVKDTSLQLTQLGLSKHLRRQAGQFSSENYW